jgi:hypothetical protein
VQASAAGWQHSGRHVPDRQFPVQQSLNEEQAAPTAAQVAEQAPVPFRIRSPSLPFPAGPSAPDARAVTRNQNTCPVSGFSGVLHEVCAVAAFRHESFAEFRRQLMLGTSPR